MPAKEVSKPAAERRLNIGRPPLSPSGSVTLNIRLTPDQREKLEFIGGVTWIRNAIDSAPAPDPVEVKKMRAAKKRAAKRAAAATTTTPKKAAGKTGKVAPKRRSQALAATA